VPLSPQLNELGATERTTGPQLSEDPLSISEGWRIPVPSGSRTNLNVFRITTGDIVSSTVTCEEHEAVFPEASVPVKITFTGAPISEQLKVVRLT